MSLTSSRPGSLFCPATRRWTLAPLLVLALAGLPSPAAALVGGDPLAGAFSKDSKAALKELKAITGAALKTAGTELKAEAAEYAAGTADATTTFNQLVATISAQRDAIEDAALAATQQLSGDGVTLLASSPSTPPGLDFQAGGAGTWDKFLASVDKALDDSDAKLDGTLTKTLAGMLKTSAKSGGELDVRWRLPQHGEGHRAVTPPVSDTPSLGPGGVLTVPQVLIAARFVDSSTTDHLAIGVRGGPPSVDLAVSSTLGEQVDLAPLALDGSGTATGSYALTGLLAGAGYITVELEPDATAGPDARFTLSLPHTQPAPADALALVKQFKKNTQSELAFFKTVAGGDVKTFGKNLADNLKSVTSQQSAPLGPAEFSFSEMRNLHDLIAFRYVESADFTVGPVHDALLSGGFTDADIPSDFAVDGTGAYAKFVRSWDKLRAKEEAAVRKAYDKTLVKLVKASLTHGPQLAINRVLGPTRTFSFPMISAVSMPPIDELVRPYASDAQIVRQKAISGSDLVEVQLAVQSDPFDVPNVVATEFEIPTLVTTTIGSLAADVGGAASTKQNLPVILPLVGWQFSAGQHATKQDSTLIVVTPALIPDLPPG
jgi:hypothetical protein